MRLILRLVAFIALSIAVILGIGDATRAVANGEIALAPLSAVLEDFSPATLDLLAQGRVALEGWGAQGLVDGLLGLPAVIVFVVLFLMLYWPSLRRRKRGF